MNSPQNFDVKYSSTLWMNSGTVLQAIWNSYNKLDGLHHWTNGWTLGNVGDSDGQQCPTEDNCILHTFSLM